jgi:MoaA/NifB/PqqE/SkfB family radical SAM enzyme
MAFKSVARRLGRNFNHLIHNRPAIFFTNILLTYQCTQRCLQCTIPALAHDHPRITFDNFRLIIDKLDHYGTQGITISGGEPMAHPDLPDMLAYAAGKSFTNIHLLTTLYASGNLVDRTLDAVFANDISLSCSFDGFGEVADTLRGGHDVARRVLSGIDQFNRRNKNRKRPLGAFLNIVISQSNLYQIPEILRMAESIGWKVNMDLYRWQSDNHRENDEMKITDFGQLANVIEEARKSPNVLTPDWLLDGYPGYLKDDFPKRCPYTDNTTLGSKFFIHPNGDIAVCIGDHIGNLLSEDPKEIFASTKWRERMKEFHACRGCWNTCYTPSARLSSYMNVKDLKQAGDLFRKIFDKQK